ncbi:DnaJ subfamily C member 1 [Fasciola gigantica]|uniref:DnaJ subfamily C member 1 n=1 Tax=Fasciola gigantica TaxID=46835 RepID=A0A504Z2P6_FASGI|nr:DnaJ subfamily C member 1 [Fasciola gigantica]
MRGILVFLVFFEVCAQVWSWDSMDLQMFDLIEEVKMSFYDYLGVDKTASGNEIRRSYRRLSVSMHPDKNIGDPTAEAKFRQLVGIYEILKDPETRERYNDVLVNGLPDWKTTVYYYRKLRKMSNLELFLLFSTLCTIVHYAVLWGVRFEKVLTLEDQLSTALKRYKARDRKREQIDLQISEQLNKIPKPKWHDILPFAICKGIWAFIRFIPNLFAFFKGQISEKIEEHRQLQRELVEDLQQKEKTKREKQERKRRMADGRSHTKEVTDAYGELFSLADLPPTDSVEESASSSVTLSKLNREWTEDDITKLVNAVARYPGGVSGRWERIADVLNRPVAQVTAKAKEIGSSKLRYFYEKTQMPDEIPVFEVNENAVCGDSSDGENNEQSSYDKETDSYQKGNQPSDGASDEADHEQSSKLTVIVGLQTF